MKFPEPHGGFGEPKGPSRGPSDSPATIDNGNRRLLNKTMWLLWTLLLILAITVVYDLVQSRHAILRNFPVVGHFRYWLEAIGPELR
jgi:hypothetical protein